MELWTAFLLGLLGSLHCAGMCGPLALALPATGKTSATFVLGRLAYNAGRIVTYGLLGAGFGLLGGTLAVAGIARWVSLVAGFAILLGLIASSRHVLNASVAKLSAWVRARLGFFLNRRTLASTFFLGAFNGLLPCGLVYAACAVAVTVGGTLMGVGYMLVFGLGTVPMILGIGLFGMKLQLAIRLKFQKLIPVGLFVVGVLLILRGMALGIPYLSPDFHGSCPACH